MLFAGRTCHGSFWSRSSMYWILSMPAEPRLHAGAPETTGQAIESHPLRCGDSCSPHHFTAI